MDLPSYNNLMWPGIVTQLSETNTPLIHCVFEERLYQRAFIQFEDLDASKFHDYSPDCVENLRRSTNKFMF